MQCNEILAYFMMQKAGVTITTFPTISYLAQTMSSICDKSNAINPQDGSNHISQDGKTTTQHNSLSCKTTGRQIAQHLTRWKITTTCSLTR
jgi:hypothetical protein